MQILMNMQIINLALQIKLHTEANYILNFEE